MPSGEEPKRKIEVVPPDPGWAAQYQQSAGPLTEVFGMNLVGIHHAGSTAIPGIHAKPTIDILVEVADVAIVDTLNPALEALGYTPKGEYGIPGRRFFVRFDGVRHIVHVHVFQSGHPDIHRLLKFRDYLSANPAEAQAYSRLKQDLALRYREDPDGYTQAKTSFIRAIDQKTTGKISDQKYLKEEQYRTAGNLEARIALHLRYGTRGGAWQPWVFDQVDFQPGTRVLEVGCGPASLWRENLERLPEIMLVVLGDLSTGMLTAARRHQVARQEFSFTALDAQALPFPPGSFDLVIANHMLYHVPDIQLAIAAIQRVLCSGGRLVAATNGAAHMRELYQLIADFDPSLANMDRAPERTFTLENGVQVLSGFRDVEKRIFDEDLLVTDPEPLLAYIRSMWGAVESLDAAQSQAFSAYVRRRFIEQGPLLITKSQGLFIARK